MQTSPLDNHHHHQAQKAAFRHASNYFIYYIFYQICLTAVRNAKIDLGTPLLPGGRVRISDNYLAQYM
jgi:hypothetical protein